jgi:putative colanic acid biosynthesis acetyltransferase WcaF
MNSKFDEGKLSDILQGVKFDSSRRSRSFTWKNILFRFLWSCVWLLLAALTPPQAYAWRRLLLNAFGAKIKSGARVYQSARILYPPNLEMGEGSVLGWNTHCYCMDKIVIEPYAEVAQFVHLVTGTHDIDSPTFQLRTKPIRICSHAWLASGAFVGPGVTVGEGAVLGARAVAFHDLEPWTVYSGNPAKPIRKRKRFA